ncbi:(2Fe-2S)-binding protein [Domibacillus epiphyticus]|uniref:(2Fe-2S)-binding protein n=1 Tax=Domibacillus epiphyticus TaxID=1714355 RepID=A0A1V2A5Q5_9BACI|nr:(2Fe-2S)-binding protein [Domibacillus epiphyticus]OMP66349.1 (2Fe-2S)-binding protein [Domibacillus epiphyticus]
MKISKDTYQKITIKLKINGEIVETDIHVSDLLLNVLRDKLGLTGAKPGCLNGDCGACTVIMNQKPMKSCLLLAIEAIREEITTIEGLLNSTIQKEFVNHFAFQCGYCTPGFVMVSHALLMNDPNPDKKTVIEWLSSNICRCTGYQEIEKALYSVIKGGNACGLKPKNTVKSNGAKKTDETGRLN